MGTELAGQGGTRGFALESPPALRHGGDASVDAALNFERKTQVALRYDRRARPGEAGQAAIGHGYSTADVGRALRQERTRQGLSLRDVSMRTGIPQDQLRAAETGSFDRPDGLAALKTVRRFADHLGLPGDRYALAILEQWPTRGRSPAPVLGVVGSVAPRTGQAPAAPNGNAIPKKESTGQLPASAGRHPAATETASLDDDRPTMAVPAGAGWSGWQSGWGGDAYGSYGGDAFFDTGVTPAVPGAQVWKPRRRMPFVLRALIAVIALCVVAGIALLAVDRMKPAWLQDLGLVQGPAQTSASAQPLSRHHAAVAATALALRRTSTDEAVVDARGPYTVKLSATGGPAWVSVTKPGVTTPVYMGVIQPGTSHSLTSTGTAIVELGSTAGRFSLTSKVGHVMPYKPPTVPFRFVIHATR